MSPSESMPLLPSQTARDHHHELFHPLDADHSHNLVHDHPPCPTRHRVKTHLTSAVAEPGHGHPCHGPLQSTSLLLRLRQSFDHGFRAVWHAVFHGIHHLPSHSSPSSAAPPAAAAVDGTNPPTDTTSSSTTTSATTTSNHNAPSSSRTATRAVFVVAVLTMLAMTSVSPTVLLFMNAATYTSPSHIAPYVTASALTTAVPIVSNVALTSLAGRVGPGRALAAASLLAALALVVVATVRGSLPVFLLAYGLYASSNSLRVVRVALLSKIVAPAKRTSVLATHALMTPIGALMGPLIWIACQLYQRSFRALGGAVVVDRFTMVYAAAAAAFVLIAAVSTRFLTTIVTYEEEHSGSLDESSSHTGADTASGQLHDALLHFADGHDVSINLERYRNRVFMYFCGIMLGVNMSAGIYMTAFQPIIVNVFHTSDAKLGLIFEMIAVFAMIPPLLVALLSRYLMDRQILVVGLMAKLIGMTLFIPLFRPVSEWQVIAGFLLIIKASIFFSTASLSLFTKLLGPMSTSSLLGLLASCAAIGPAVTQILLSSRIVEWFGSAWFLLFATPAVLSLLAILWPSKWQKLDPTGEFTQLVTHEAGLQKAGEA